MKGLVIYDSYHGNTKAVAEAIAEEIRATGHEVILQSVRERSSGDLDADFVILGSPTRWAKMTRRSKKVISSMGKGPLRSRPLFTFDTIMPGVLDNPGRWSGTAAQKLHDLAKEEGLTALEPVLHTEVTGMRGPLAADAIEKAKVFTRDALSKIGK